MHPLRVRSSLLGLLKQKLLNYVLNWVCWIIYFTSTNLPEHKNQRFLYVEDVRRNILLSISQQFAARVVCNALEIEWNAKAAWWREAGSIWSPQIKVDEEMVYYRALLKKK